MTTNKYNESTNKKFKSVVRILKNLCNEMSDNGDTIAKATPSYLIECLCYNVPNDKYEISNSYVSIVREILAYLFNNTIKDSDCSKWFEVNNIKYLFHSSQKWSSDSAHLFISNAWDHIGYK